MLHSLLEHLSTAASSFVEKYGLLGIFLGMVLESACIPIPSEVIMLTGGWFVQQGTLSPWGVVAAGVLGNLVGSLLIFWVGSRGARSIVDKYGKYVMLNPKHMHQAEHWFTRYGEWVTFIGRNLPFIRTFISLPAGIAKMYVWKFAVFTFLGCIPWNVALTYLGYQLGNNWKEAEAYIRPVSYAICGIIVLLVLRMAYRLWKSKKHVISLEDEGGR